MHSLKRKAVTWVVRTKDKNTPEDLDGGAKIFLTRCVAMTPWGSADRLDKGLDMGAEGQHQRGGDSQKQSPHQPAKPG